MEAAKAKLEEHKNSRINVEAVVEEKLADLRAVVLAEDEKIRAQIKEKMGDPVRQIEEEVTVARKILQKKQALLKERDFMI